MTLADMSPFKRDPVTGVDINPETQKPFKDAVERDDFKKRHFFQGIWETAEASGLGRRATDAEMAEHRVLYFKAIIDELFPNFSWDDDSHRTAERFLSYLEEYVPTPNPPFTFTMFHATANQLIVVRDIEFASICMHHLLPFQGVCHVGYIPGEWMVGVSKIPRLVDWLAKQPRTQETLTADIAAYMKTNLKAMGVAVVMDAVHTCMSCRGVRKVGATMRTSDMRGIFLTADAARNEFLRMSGL